MLKALIEIFVGKEIKVEIYVCHSVTTAIHTFHFENVVIFFRLNVNWMYKIEFKWYDIMFLFCGSFSAAFGLTLFRFAIGSWLGCDSLRFRCARERERETDTTSRFGIMYSVWASVGRVDNFQCIWMVCLFRWDMTILWTEWVQWICKRFYFRMLFPSNLCETESMFTWIFKLIIHFTCQFWQNDVRRKSANMLLWVSG